MHFHSPKVNNSISEHVNVNTAKENLKKTLKIFLAFENNKKKQHKYVFKKIYMTRIAVTTKYIYKTNIIFT